MVDSFLYERQGYAAGFTRIAGIDEVGRGPLAGPVLACAMILPQDCLIEGIKDSKKLSPQKREVLAAQIKAQAVDWAVGMADAAEVDTVNILNATKLAMQRAVAGLSTLPGCLLIDGKDTLSSPIPQQAIIGGDGKSITIAAASIVAKVMRDALMLEYHVLYPGYGFDKHKGYGTKAHREAIRQNGLCPIHRRSFMKKWV